MFSWQMKLANSMRILEVIGGGRSPTPFPSFPFLLKGIIHSKIKGWQPPGPHPNSWKKKSRGTWKSMEISGKIHVTHNFGTSSFFTKRWCLFFPFPPSIHKAKQTNRWLFASLPTTLAAPSTSPNISLTSQERLMPSDLCWSIPATRFPRMGFKILAFKTKLLKRHTSWGMQKCGKMKESGNIHNCGCMHIFNGEG